MKNKKNHITRCRICDNPDLIGVMGYAGISTSEKNAQILICDQRYNDYACGLLQRKLIEHSFLDNKSLREGQGNYADERTSLRSIVNNILNMSKSRGKRILDLGYADGSLLSYFPKDYELIGVDPAIDASDITNFASQHNVGLNNKELNAELGNKKNDIITQIGNFSYHDNPLELAIWVKKHLSTKGLWVLQIPYLPLALSKGMVEFFHAGNATYPSLHSLGEIAEQVGLKIVRMDFAQKSNSNAIYYLTHLENDVYDLEPWLIRLSKLWDEEASLFMGVPASYQAFSTRVEDTIEQARQIIETAIIEKKKIYLIGASTKTETLSYLLNLKDTHSAVYLVSHDCQQSGTLGNLTDIPVISNISSFEQPADIYICPQTDLMRSLTYYKDQIYNGSIFVVMGNEVDIIDKTNYQSYMASMAESNENMASGTLRLLLRNQPLKLVSEK